MFIVRLRIAAMRFARRVRVAMLRRLYGMDIAKSAYIGRKVKLDRTNPRGIHIGDYSFVTEGTLVLTHDHVRGYLTTDTYIGSRTFVGSHSIIMPGIRIGDQSIVAAGSVVTKDVASNSVVGGNPAKVLKTGINMSAVTRLVDYNALRIVTANNHLYLRGGSERVMFDEVEAQRCHGHEVVLFGGRSPASAAFPHADLFPESTDFGAGNALRRAAAARDLIYNTRVRGAFARLCSRARPDIVHCHNIYGGLTTAVLDVCRAKRIPSVITLHDYKIACPSYTMLAGSQPCSSCTGGRFYNCLLRRCHKGSLIGSAVYTLESYFNHFLRKYLQAAFLIAPSRFLMGRMMQHGIPAARIRWIPNGIDPLRYRPALSDNGYFLYLGRLSREKGLATLLAAMSEQTMPLRILGEGPLRSVLERTAAERGLTRISFEGHRSGPALEQAVRGAAFIVVPSEWYENASMAVLEAMAYGKPVVAALIGGIPEQVDHGRTGVLFEAGNATALAHAIRTLESNPALRVEMGFAGRRRVEEEFSLALHCNRLNDLYREAIHG